MREIHHISQLSCWLELSGAVQACDRTDVFEMSVCSVRRHIVEPMFGKSAASSFSTCLLQCANFRAQ